MLFFDDEKRNITSVSQLGWCSLQSVACLTPFFISFRECFRRRILKPMDSIVVSLMKSLQPAGELCLRAVVDDVRHCLPLSALTQVRLSHAQTMEASTAGTVACPEPVQKGPRLTR